MVHPIAPSLFSALPAQLPSRTNPWIACEPKCIVGAPPNFNVIFEYLTTVPPAVPPVISTVSVHVDTEQSNGSGGLPFPFPVPRFLYCYSRLQLAVNGNDVTTPPFASNNVAVPSIES